jgi:transposase
LATVASRIETAKLDGLNPHAWLTDTLTKLVGGWPQSRVDGFMPCTHTKPQAP